MYAFLISPQPASGSAHLILLDLINLIICGEKYKLLSPLERMSWSQNRLILFFVVFLISVPLISVNLRFHGSRF